MIGTVRFHAPSRRDLLRLLAGTACAAPLPAEFAKLPPVDEAGRDAGLAALLAKIRGFTARRDARGLESLMLPTFRVEFDYGKGPQAFHRRWQPESRNTALWTVMQRLFELGGTFYSDTLFAMPYVFTRFPPELDPLAHVVAVKAGARMLDRPAAGGSPLAMPDYAILPLANRLQPPVSVTPARYFEVKTGDAGHAYVADADVYSPAAHRAFFEKRAGRWRWITLVCATLAEPPDLKHPKHSK
jgi:hypothetical protein